MAAAPLAPANSPRKTTGPTSHLHHSLTPPVITQPPHSSTPSHSNERDGRGFGSGTTLSRLPGKPTVAAALKAPLVYTTNIKRFTPHSSHPLPPYLPRLPSVSPDPTTLFPSATRPSPRSCNGTLPSKEPPGREDQRRNGRVVLVGQMSSHAIPHPPFQVGQGSALKVRVSTADLQKVWPGADLTLCEEETSCSFGGSHQSSSAPADDIFLSFPRQLCHLIVCLSI